MTAANQMPPRSSCATSEGSDHVLLFVLATGNQKYTVSEHGYLSYLLITYVPYEEALSFGSPEPTTQLGEVVRSRGLSNLKHQV